MALCLGVFKMRWLIYGLSCLLIVGSAIIVSSVFFLFKYGKGLLLKYRFMGWQGWEGICMHMSAAMHVYIFLYIYGGFSFV